MVLLIGSEIQAENKTNKIQYPDDTVEIDLGIGISRSCNTAC